MKSFTNPSICIALAALAGAGTAAADVHVDSTGHGGRIGPPGAAAAAVKTPAATLGGSSSQGAPVVGEVAKNRRTVTLNAAYLADCPSGETNLSSTKLAAAKVKKNGRYSIARTIRLRFDDGYTLVETYQAGGRLTKTGTSGSLSVTDDWTKPDGTPEAKCSTGTQKYRLYDSGTFAGTTDQGAPVVLQHSPGRDRVTKLLIPWLADCKGGAQMWGIASITAPITARGAFGGTMTHSTDFGGGLTGQITQVLSGSMSARKVIGTWRSSASILDQSQAEVDTCDTGMRSFRLT
jgi:hypothetical protein